MNRWLIVISIPIIGPLLLLLLRGVMRSEAQRIQEKMEKMIGKIEPGITGTELHIPIYHVSSVQAAAFTNTTYGVPKKETKFNFNLGNLDKVKAVYFEALMGVTPPNVVYAKLRNTTDGVDVVEVTSPSRVPTKRRSGDIKDLLPKALRQYEADWRVSGGTGEIYQARLVIVQGV